MKKSSKALLTLLFGSLVFASCDNCDTAQTTPLTDQDVEWLVYDRGDTIRFVDENAKTSTYIRTSIYSDNVPGEGFSVSDKCVDKLDVQVSNVIQDRLNKKPGLGAYILKRPETLTVKIAVEDQGTWEIDETNPTYSSLDVNGTTYDDVFEVKPDSIKANSVKRILFNKDNGFLSVNFYNGSKLELSQYIKASN